MGQRSQKSQAKTNYQALSETLVDDIKNGQLLPGDRLPSEEKLVSTLGYSPGTVQRALRHLVELGVVSVHGSGTFVTGGQAPEEHLHHFRFLSEDGATLLPIFFKAHGLEHTHCKGPWVDCLGQDRAGYVHIQRVISVNREFEVFSELYLPARKFPTLLEMKAKDLDGVSIRDMLAERFESQTVAIQQSIICDVFPPRAIGQFGMILTASSTAHRQVPIIWQRAYIPPSDRQMEFISNLNAPLSATSR